MLALLLAPLAAHAGHYDVVYSGGRWTQTYLGSPASLQNGIDGSYASNAWGHEDYVALNSYMFPEQTFADMDCSGDITATFTWKPDNISDLPPKSAVITEFADADWYGYGIPGTAISGNCFNPLGGSPVIYSYGEGESWPATKYWVKDDPGTSFQVVCTPMAEASASAGGSSFYGYGIATVEYRAAADPVTVTLQGTTKDSDGSDNILIGQGCTASVNVSSPAGVGISGWIISGPTFSRFAIGANQNTGAAIPAPDPYVAHIDEHPHFFWRKGGDYGSAETVQVAGTAYWTDSVGGWHSIGNVTAQKKVNVWNPYVGDANFEIGPVTSTADGVMTTSGDGVQAGGDPGTGVMDGFKFQGAVGTPALFKSRGAGVWAWLQLCKLYRDYGPNGDGTKMTDYFLDTSFPYNTSAASGTTPGTPSPADSTEGVPDYYPFMDSPLQETLPISGSVSVNDTFRLYMMYNPPDAGNGTDWVPLLVELWGWKADATRIPGLNNWWPIPFGLVYYWGHQMYPEHPSWTSRFVGSH